MSLGSIPGHSSSYYHRWVMASYGVAGTYVAADTVEKYWRAQQNEKYTIAQRRMLGASNASKTCKLV